MTIPSALITGIGGQDGAYLAQLLVAKGYRVTGFDVVGSGLQTPPGCRSVRGLVKTYEGDVSDPAFVSRILAESAPTELYHLASYSHVGESFDIEDEVQLTNFGGTKVVFDAVLAMPKDRRPRIYNACSSEVFGTTTEPVTETTPFNPTSPYAKSKAEAYKYGRHVRETHGLHLSHGFMFNHESPLRSREFVSRKLTNAAAMARQGFASSTALGNLNASRDWGHAQDYVDAMWRMLQRPAGDDYVIASGRARSVREFATTAFSEAGISLKWRGTGVNEIALDDLNRRGLIHVDPAFLRPADSDVARGNTSKAQQILGWRPRISFESLVAEMVAEDVRRLETKVLAQA